MTKLSVLDVYMGSDYAFAAGFWLGRSINCFKGISLFKCKFTFKTVVLRCSSKEVKSAKFLKQFFLTENVCCETHSIEMTCDLSHYADITPRDPSFFTITCQYIMFHIFGEVVPLLEKYSIRIIIFSLALQQSFID